MNRKESRGHLPGEDLVIEGIDPDLIPIFARVCRILGLVVAAATYFLLWSYELSGGRTILDSIARSGGLRGSEAMFASFLWSAPVPVLGWIFRLQIGRLFVGGFFILLDLLSIPLHLLKTMLRKI